MLPPIFAARQWHHRPKLLLQAVASLLVLAPTLLHATIFNWPGTGWTAGAPAPGQTVTQSFTAVTPNDITVKINNNGASVAGATWQPAYPAIDSTTETGGFTGVNGLQFYLSQQSSTASFVRTTITFSSPVTNLSLQIWDVDAVSGQFADKIFNIQALTVGNTTVGPDSVTSAVAGFNTITGSGLTTVILGTALASDTTNQGTINITFLGPITQFSFDWSNNDPALGGQAIALGPLTFNFVPELSTGWLAALLCATAIGTQQISIRKKRRR